jgi:hypothetical protein
LRANHTARLRHARRQLQALRTDRWRSNGENYDDNTGET